MKIRVIWIKPDGITSFVDIPVEPTDDREVQIEKAKAAGVDRFYQQYGKEPSSGQLSVQLSGIIRSDEGH